MRTESEDMEAKANNRKEWALVINKGILRTTKTKITLSQ
jgi:hypothetical protein